MKNFKKFVFFVLISALLMVAIIMSGCYDGEFVEDKGMFLGYSKSKKRAFVGQLQGDWDNTDFVIPDEYRGYPVTTLGGVIGRGFPCPFDFYLELPEEYREYDDAQLSFATQFSVFDETGDGWETVIFYITLGRNVRQIERATPCRYLGIIAGYDEDGLPIHDLLYKIVPYFTVPEENKTFYAEEGRLYYKNSGAPAGEFEYE